MSYREIIEIDEKAVPTIYHYCSSGAFLSIISNKKIWLSDINTMNDFGEMHWAYDRFMEAANNVINEIGESFISKVDEIISTSQQRVLPMLCSFSTDGDVLSQWRAYSENGKGVAIGFSTKELKKLGLKLGRVEYNRAAQVQHFSLFLRALHKVYNDLGPNERDEALFDFSAEMAVDMCFFKVPGFSEELEIRAVRAINVNNNEGIFSFKDTGADSVENETGKELDVKFRSSLSGGIIGYIELPFDCLGSEAISEVVIGPASQNNGNEISAALSAQGYNSFSIRKSESTYRA